ncbi:hypothetical protein [Reyranella sp.]|uniref:hypothetical protein n=1 Tax=Reyranella sp. TaxID=1929291 RepID=UPI003C7A3BB3
MTMFILLTGEQADHVRGPSAITPSAALAPVERQGELFVLGIEVLADPAHMAHWDYLALLPQLDGNDPSLPEALSAVDA